MVKIFNFRVFLRKVMKFV